MTTSEPLAQVARALGNLRTPAQPHTDPFRPDTVLPTGRYRGECADIDTKRSVRVLEPAEAARYQGRPDELVVANFFHDDRFWVARIRRDAVERVVMQQVNFEAVVPAAHGQVRYTMREDAPVILTPQDPTDRSGPVALREIILSIEATTVPEQPYDVIQGLRGRYVNSYRLTSLEARYNNDIPEDRQVLQFPLNVDATTANRILESGLRYATDRRQDEVYNTITESCLIGTFRYIDRALGIRRVPWRGYGVYPVWLDGYIRLRGLSAGQLPNLEREMPTLNDVHRVQNVPVPADRG